MAGALEVSEEPFQFCSMILGWDLHAGRQYVGGVRNIRPRAIGQVSDVSGSSAEDVGCRSVQKWGLLGVCVAVFSGNGVCLELQLESRRLSGIWATTRGWNSCMWPVPVRKNFQLRY